MRTATTTLTLAAILFLAALGLTVTSRVQAQNAPAVVRPGSFDEVIQNASGDLFRRGQQIFRFDTFGDERFWSDTLRLHQAVAGAANGGVGSGLSPAAALGAGLKVDVDMVPRAILTGIQSGAVNLNDPANTLALIAARLYTSRRLNIACWWRSSSEPVKWSRIPSC